MRYAMLIVGSEDEWSRFTPEQVEAGIAEVNAWFGRWAPTGRLAEGSTRLDAAGTARTVAPGPAVSDGPVAGIEFALSAIVMLEADTIDEAVEVASSWPRLTGTTRIEVRSVAA